MRTYAGDWAGCQGQLVKGEYARKVGAAEAKLERAERKESELERRLGELEREVAALRSEVEHLAENNDANKLFARTRNVVQGAG